MASFNGYCADTYVSFCLTLNIVQLIHIIYILIYVALNNRNYTIRVMDSLQSLLTGGIKLNLFYLRFEIAEI